MSLPSAGLAARRPCRLLPRSGRAPRLVRSSVWVYAGLPASLAPEAITWPARMRRAYDAAALEAWGLAAQVNLTLPGVLAAQPAGQGQAGDAAMPLAGSVAGARPALLWLWALSGRRRGCSLMSCPCSRSACCSPVIAKCMSVESVLISGCPGW